MYNIQENVRIVVKALKLYNIRYIVISPGGTNIPITQAVQHDPFFRCFSIPDERSAMYFAIGLHLHTGEIIATSCTSAQATRNYIPGLTEAYYKHTPILALTTSKLERFAYQEYMQAPDQISLPCDSVKKSYDLPPVTDDNTKVQCIRVTKEAILELTHRSPGPVQLNIRINDTLNSRFSDMNLPTIRKTERYHAWDEWNDVELTNEKILIVVGEHRPFTISQKELIEEFSEHHDVVIYTNHLSNYRGKYTINGNLILSSVSRQTILEKLKPDIILTIGGQTGDYPLYGSLNMMKDVEHWRISEDGAFVDTYNKLTKIFECNIENFFKRFRNNYVDEHTYYKIWKGYDMRMNRKVNLPLSNIYIAQQLSSIIPDNSIMNFAILNSLRAWEYFDLLPSIHCYSNVAAFGIDGCTSTLIGESMDTDSLCFMVTGDLAFFYDMNVLGLRHIKNNVRIILINNGGGAEFKIMTHNWKDKPETDLYISAMGHNGSAKGWAENCGFLYMSARTKEDIQKIKEDFVKSNNKPILLEAFTQPSDEEKAMELITSINREQSATSTIKSMAKNILGEDVVNKLKKLKN